jgi:hypothetical protein
MVSQSLDWNYRKTISVLSQRFRRSTVDDYISDILLVLSVIGAPIVLGLLLFYGMTMTERRHHGADTEKRTEAARQKPYVPPEQDRRAKEKAARPSNRLLDMTKHGTGTSG